MDRKEMQNTRLYLLAALLTLALTAYLFVLYDVQVIHHDEYAAQALRSIVRTEKVEASRGVITDRNGKPLVSNRSTYDLTFDAALLSPDDDSNQAILRLVQLCQAEGVAWSDNLPISRLAPYRYTGETAGAVTAEEIPGTYKLVNHGRAITDEISLSVNITLGKDGRISCKENEDLSGTWALTGDSQAELTIDGRTYTGLFLVQWDEDGQKEVMTFTALDDETGMCVWGSGVNAR